jgi:hypothetical protein
MGIQKFMVFIAVMFALLYFAWHYKLFSALGRPDLAEASVQNAKTALNKLRVLEGKPLLS